MMGFLIVVEGFTMSVEKFIVTKEDSGYTITPNHVIHFLQKHLEILGLWVSLSSLPPNWEFHKTKMMSDFGLGRDKLRKYLNFLEKCNLIEQQQLRNPDGSFGDIVLHIKSGRDFKPVTENQSTDNSPLTDLPATANRLLVTAPYKRKKIKETSKENKQKSFLDKKTENAKKHPFAESMDQMANEERHIKEHEHRKNEERRGGMPDHIREAINKSLGKTYGVQAEN